MNSKEIKKYADISNLNKEAYMFFEFIGTKFFPDVIKTRCGNQLLLSIKSEDLVCEETEEWVGFVKTMKIFVSKQFNQRNE